MLFSKLTLHSHLSEKADVYKRDLAFPQPSKSGAGLRKIKDTHATVNLTSDVS